MFHFVGIGAVDSMGDRACRFFLSGSGVTVSASCYQQFRIQETYQEMR